MPRRFHAAIGGAILLCAGTATSAVGCHGEENATADAGAEARPDTDSGPLDAVMSSVLAVDFTVTGCPLLNLKVPECTGRAPLTLTFIPINTLGINRYLWDFGDKSDKSDKPTPTHTYVDPGPYEVTLVAAGANGTVAKSRDTFVIVMRNGLGDACDGDNQCQADLACVCGNAVQCPVAFARGICAASCRDKACGAMAVCADLTLGTTKPDPWQQPLCLRGCASDQDCSPGLRCRDLPARTPPGGWVKGCFAEVPADLGASCRSAGGQLRNDLCATGTCVNMGANGLCTFDCAGAACPGDGVCAGMNTGQSLCLRPCTPTFTCSDDPLLACVAMDTTGPLGFRLPATAPPGPYCAARRCTNNNDCGPSGICITERGGSHCLPRP